MHNVRAFIVLLSAVVIFSADCAPSFPEAEAVVADLLMAARTGDQANMTKVMPSLGQLAADKRYKFMLSLSGFRTFRVVSSRKAGDHVVVSVVLRYLSGAANNLEVSVGSENQEWHVLDVVITPEKTEAKPTTAPTGRN